MGLSTVFGQRAKTDEWTLSSYFGKFLSNIEPSDERVGVISDAHRTLRDHLGSEEAELSYPLRGDFLSGSYARHTATGTVKDADIILPLSGATLSADLSQPSPRAVLNNLKSVVDKFYDEVDLQQQRRSIQVFLSEDDVRMDLVPAIAPDGTDELLYVPDYEQKMWIESHPKGHIAGSSKRNADTGGRYVRLVKVFKWWRDVHIDEDERPKSFLLECIIREASPAKAKSIAKMFEQTLEEIIDRYGDRTAVPVIADPALPSNDLAKSCSWTKDEFDIFINACEESLDLARAALQAGTKTEAISKWRELFGDEFPSTLTGEEEKRFRDFDFPAVVVLPQSFTSPTVSTKAWTSPRQGGSLQGEYPRRDGRPLPKGTWIKFQTDGLTIPAPYQIRWRVQNNGREAREAGHLAHSTFPGTETQWEHTAYRGHHFMFCEIVKDGRVVASARHDVRIR